MSNAQATVEPVRRAIKVDCTVDHAFATFTEDIGRWWPLHTHSIGVYSEKTPPEGAAVEPRVGGRLYETMKDGRELAWGEFRVWEPPSRIVFSWHPGSEVAKATEVEVRFSPDGAGTRVELEHRGFEILGEEAVASRDSYGSGWPGVMDCYAKVAGAAV